MLLTDTRLIEKRRRWRESYARGHEPEVLSVVEQRRTVLDQMKATLGDLSLAKPAGQLAKELSSAGVNPEHASYACKAIEHGDNDGLLVDPFGFRVHSIVTRTAAEIRPHMRVEGEPLTEVDVVNAQPLILAAAFRSAQGCTTYVAGAQHIGRGGAPVAGFSPELLKGCADEIEEFAALCQEGQLYEHLLASGAFPNRETVKKQLYRDVLFGNLRIRGKMTEVFGGLWPGLLKAIRSFKQDQGYKAVAKLLQRLESQIMIDGVCRRLVERFPSLPFLTVHDAALIVRGATTAVSELILEEFSLYGVSATVHEEDYRAGPGARRKGQASTVDPESGHKEGETEVA